ncbi:MAG: ABC transporter substrate-binding protein [Idiomarina sp.]|nr:ABC transporter substrate-binding protein [Idiomarina sp.]
MSKPMLHQKLASFLFMSSILLSLTMPAKTYAANEISTLNWVINTAPPFHIVNGTHAGKGICDALMDIVDEQLPELASSRVVLPQTRIRQQFEREVDQCFPCMIYSPTPSDTVQTEPTHFYYPHGVITTKKKALIMQERHGNPVRLASLITDREFRFGYPDGRHYPAVQSIVDQAVQSDVTRVAHTGENATVAILSMIKAERIDYTIDYQILHNFDIAENEATDLAFLEIAETQGEHVLGAIGCTNTEWGRAVVKEINRIMPKVQQHPEFLNVLDLWFNDNPESEPYRELLRKRVWYATGVNQ